MPAKQVMISEQRAGTRWKWLEWAIPVLIVALAAFFRLYRLNQVPPGFNFDEAAHAIDALDILAGHHTLFSPKLQGVESFFMYCTAGIFVLLGPSALAQRLLSAVIGIATIAVTYLMVREMFREEGERRRTWLAALAALGLATSFWHVNYSRIGLEVGMTPFFAALSFLFLWRGLHTNRTLDFVLSGVWMGVNPYSHLPARFMPIPVVLFFIIRWAATSRAATASGTTRVRHLLDSFRPLFIIGLAALVTYAPMGAYFILHPSDFLGRSAVTSIFNPTMNQGDFWGTLWRSAWGTFGGFGFIADVNWLANLPGKSILNPVLAVLFWLGVLLTFVRIRRLPYLFIFLTWFTLLLPAVITPERSPHYSRMMITACVAYIFPAIALVTLGDLLERLSCLGRHVWFTCSAAELRHTVGYPETSPAWQQWAVRIIRVGVWLAVAVLFALTGLSTYHDYFDVWAKSDAHYMAFDGYAVELAEQIRAEDDPNATYVIPRDIRAAEFYPHYTLDFLLRDGAPYCYIPMQEANVPARLTEAGQGKTVIHLVRWKMDKHKEADPKGYVDMLLEKFGRPVGMRSFPAYDIATYELPAASVDFTRSVGYELVGADFGGEIALCSAAYGNAGSAVLDEGHSVPSAGSIWLMLDWEKRGTSANDYRTSIILEDTAGHAITRTDRDLIHEWHMRTGTWPVGEPVGDYYLLRVPAGTPPGDYVLRALVYDAQTLQPLPLAGTGVTTALLGTLHIVPPAEPVAVDSASIPVPLDIDVGDGIVLAGLDFDLARPYAPGDSPTMTLYWQVDSSPRSDWRVAIALRGDNGRTELWPPARPLGDGYPTDRWRTGEGWRGLYDLRIPPDLASGEYNLVLAVTDPAGTITASEFALGRLKIAGRARSFDIPKIAHPSGSSLGDGVRFLGYDLATQNLRTGDTLVMTLYWQAVARMETSYSIFVHVLDAAGQVRAQRDLLPGNGEAPTPGWIEGEVIADRVEIPLGTDLQAGDYTLEIGMYDPATGVRLPVSEEGSVAIGDHIILGEKVQIR